MTWLGSEEAKKDEETLKRGPQKWRRDRSLLRQSTRIAVESETTKGRNTGEESFVPEKAQFVATISRTSRAKNAVERSTIVFRSVPRCFVRRLY